MFFKMALNLTSRHAQDADANGRVLGGKEGQNDKKKRRTEEGNRIINSELVRLR